MKTLLDFSEILNLYGIRCKLPEKHKNKNKLNKKIISDFFDLNKNILKSQFIHPNFMIKLRLNLYISNFYKKKNKGKIRYFFDIDNKAFEIKFYIYAWDKIYQELYNSKDKIVVNEYKKLLVNDSGLLNLDIEKNTSSTIINHRNYSYRLDGIFKLKKINICIEIMENHHIKKDEMDFSRSLKDALTECTFKEKNKGFCILSFWEFKLKDSNYLEIFCKYLLNLAYTFNVTEKKFVINKLYETFKNINISKAIYNSHKNKKLYTINFKQFFNNLLKEKETKILYNELFSNSQIIENNNLCDSDDDDLDNFSINDLEIDSSEDFIIDKKGDNIDNTLLNFYSFQDCLNFIIYSNKFDKNTRKNIKDTRDDILNKLIESYKEIFKLQKQFLLFGNKIDSDKTFF